MQRFYGRRSTFNLPTFNPRAPRLSPHLLSPLAARLTPRPSRLGRPRSRRGSFHRRRSTVGARSTAETSRVRDVPPHPRSTRNLQPATCNLRLSPLASRRIPSRCIPSRRIPSRLTPRIPRLTPCAKTLEVGTSSEQAWILPPATFDGWRQIHGGDLTGRERSTSPTFNARPATCNLQPATCNLQPATCNLQPATCNLQPATCNLQPATFASSLITPPPVPPASRLWRPAHRRRRADAG
jgi:hypothetical protein